jgi:hypothetical protein
VFNIVKTILGRADVDEFLQALDQALTQEIDIIMIGGGAMTLRSLKAGTLDVDIIVRSRRIFDTLKSGLLQIGFTIDEQLHDIAVYQQAMMVFIKNASRVDVFIKSVCGMLDFTNAMCIRAEAYGHYDKLTAKLAANEDIFLLKALAGREKDLSDCHALSQTGLKWELIIKECVRQHRPDSKWVFWLFEQICRMEDRFATRIHVKRRIFEICCEHWTKRPPDFMGGFTDNQIFSHLPKKLQKDVLMSLRKKAA